MELLELKNKTLEIFNVDSVEFLGGALMAACMKNDTEKIAAFDDLIEGDREKDYLQMIYQYYLADRLNWKQDFTPPNLGKFMSKLIGQSSETIDMCAGSGSLTIQRCNDNPDGKMICLEINALVMPYLVFNLVLQNVEAEVHRCDILKGEYYELYNIQKGDKYGKISYIEPAL